jgi:hypothetical protein
VAAIIGAMTPPSVVGEVGSGRIARRAAGSAEAVIVLGAPEKE